MNRTVTGPRKKFESPGVRQFFWLNNWSTDLKVRVFELPRSVNGQPVYSCPCIFRIWSPYTSVNDIYICIAFKKKTIKNGIDEVSPAFFCYHTRPQTRAKQKHTTKSAFTYYSLVSHWPSFQFPFQNTFQRCFRRQFDDILLLINC